MAAGSEFASFGTPFPRYVTDSLLRSVHVPVQVLLAGNTIHDSAKGIDRIRMVGPSWCYQLRGARHALPRHACCRVRSWVKSVPASATCAGTSRFMMGERDLGLGGRSRGAGEALGVCEVARCSASRRTARSSICMVPSGRAARSSSPACRRSEFEAVAVNATFLFGGVAAGGGDALVGGGACPRVCVVLPPLV
jgi:hypothetical protein